MRVVQCCRTDTDRRASRSARFVKFIDMHKTLIYISLLYVNIICLNSTNRPVTSRRVLFSYNLLRAETIRCLEKYIKTKRVTLVELKDHFQGFLPEKERKKIKNVKNLVKALEKAEVIGANDVEPLKTLAVKLKSGTLRELVEEFEAEFSGKVRRSSIMIQM